MPQMVLSRPFPELELTDQNLALAIGNPSSLPLSGPARTGTRPIHEKRQ
jgi:hypothetical protein